MHSGTTEEDLRRRLALAEALTRATTDCLYVFDFDANEFRYQNTTVKDFLGYTDAEVGSMDEDFYVFIGHPDETDAVLENKQAQRALREGELLERRFRLRHSDGGYRWYSLRVTPFSSRPDGTSREVLGLLRDIHETVEREQRLDESEQRFRELFDRSPSAIAIVTDDGRFAEVNDALCEFVGMTREQLIGSCYDDVVHPDERPAARARRVVYRDSPSTTFRSERRFLRSDGSERWARTSVTRLVDNGETVNLVSFADVTATKQIEIKLRHAALHDTLTGLPNRRLLVDRIENALARRARSTRPLAVLYVDLDRVKRVNDCLGHDAGDDLLITISRRLEAAVRGTDTVARVGGDEFVLVCPDLESDAEAVVVAERVLEATRFGLLDNNGEPITTSSSVGVALASPGLNNPHALIGAADRAMYAAKHSGRNRYVLADDPNAHTVVAGATVSRPEHTRTTAEAPANAGAMSTAASQP